jgi:hypothetical protein
MSNFADGASIASSQVPDHFNVLRSQIQVELDTDLQLVRIFTSPIASCALRRWWRFGSSRRQGEALDVPALHRPWCESVRHVGWSAGAFPDVRLGPDIRLVGKTTRIDRPDFGGTVWVY